MGGVPRVTALASRLVKHMAHDVFISYCHTDKSVGDAVCAGLEARGLRCWIAPRDIVPGSEWTEAIVDAIGTARTMVLIFSVGADASPQVRREVERAVHHGIPIIPVRIEDVMPGKAMSYLISLPHWMDAMNPPLDARILELAQGLKSLLHMPGGATAQMEARHVPAGGKTRRGGPRVIFAAALGLAVVAVAVAALWSRLRDRQAAHSTDAAATAPVVPRAGASAPAQTTGIPLRRLSTRSRGPSPRRRPMPAPGAAGASHRSRATHTFRNARMICARPSSWTPPMR
jgi:hypothetical protein